MNRSFPVLITALLTCAVATAQTAQEELPPAETLLDRHVEATGGERAHRSLKTRRRTGTLAVDMAGHTFEADVVEQWSAPNKSHTVIDSPFLSQVNVCNGRHAWEWRPGSSESEGASGDTRLLEGADKSRALDKALLHAAADWRKRFAAVETVRLTEVAGQPAYEVLVTAKGGGALTHFYDTSTGRLVKRVESLSSGHLGELEMQVFLEDYREFDGVWVAMNLRAVLNSSELGEGTQTWTYATLEHDLEVPASLFEVPEEIRDQVHRADAGGAGTDAADGR